MSNSGFYYKKGKDILYGHLIEKDGMTLLLRGDNELVMGSYDFQDILDYVGGTIWHSIDAISGKGIDLKSYVSQAQRI